jgi:hypothetical protein
MQNGPPRRDWGYYGDNVVTVQNGWMADLENAEDEWCAEDNRFPPHWNVHRNLRTLSLPLISRNPT